MVRKVLLTLVAAPALTLLTAGSALAQDTPLLNGLLGPSTTNAGFDNAPVVQNDTSPLVDIVGPVADARCAAPWTDGPAAGAIGTDYNACNTAPMDNERHEASNNGLVGLS